MSRRVFFAVSVSFTFAAAFTAVSLALGSDGSPHLRPNLPAAQLPVTALPETTSVAINNLIGAHAAARFGITADSYTQVRRLAATAAGPLYLIPGSHGACVAMVSGVSCGDPGAPDEPILGLVVSTLQDNRMLGGGITDDATSHVTLEIPGQAAVAVDVARGVFVVSEAAALKPQAASSDHNQRFTRTARN